MDIEKTKRVNALARELKEHGIASDYEDAYRQAEKMIESGLESPDSQSDDISIRPYVPKEEPVKQASQPSLGLDALETRNMKNRLDALEQQLNIMFLKINEIVTEMNHAEKKKAESPIEIRHTREEEKEEKQRDTQANLKTQHSEAHPRTGDYKPSDVSIEKMFYFGGSR